MLRLRLFVITVFVASWFLVSVGLAGTAGVFQYPVSPYSEYTLADEEPHMTFRTDIINGSPLNGYHMGEDWNAIDGDDLGDPLYALADGKVVYVQNNPNAITGKGRMVIIRYTLPTGIQVDHAYYHMNSISVAHNQDVNKGAQVGTIGNTGGVASHLHWQTEVDLSLPVGQNPYHNFCTSPTLVGGIDYCNGRPAMTITNVLKYTSPSLFVDDRSVDYQYGLYSGSWTFFSVPSGVHAPISTTFVNRMGERKSIDKAISAGWISSYGIIWNENGQWWYSTDPMSITFVPGVTYGIYPVTGGNMKLVVLAPLHTQDNIKDRAKADILHAADSFGGYDMVDPDEFSQYRDDGTFVYYFMPIWWTNGQTNCGYTNGAVAQATHKANPLIRYTSVYDKNSCSWSPWVRYDANELY